MTQALTTVGNSGAALEAQNWTQDQLQLIINTVAKGATQNELQLFLYRCRNLGLDPLKPGQIHFVKYGNSPGTIVVGIEGFRSKAARTGKLNGVKRGVTRDEKGNILTGWAKVYRKDWDHPAEEEVPFAEYNTGKSNWAKMPETMIKKVAEAAALRMAFPDDLGGIYTREEMEQAEAPTVRPEQPGENDGDTSGKSLGYRIPFGKFKQRALEEIDINDLRSYIEFLEKSAAKKGVEIEGAAKDFIERASEYIAAFENSEIESEEWES